MNVIPVQFQRNFVGSSSSRIVTRRCTAHKPVCAQKSPPSASSSSALPFVSPAVIISISTRRSCLSKLWPVAPDNWELLPRPLLRVQELGSTRPRRRPRTSPSPTSIQSYEVGPHVLLSDSPQERTSRLCSRLTCTRVLPIAPSPFTCRQDFFIDRIFSFRVLDNSVLKPIVQPFHRGLELGLLVQSAASTWAVDRPGVLCTLTDLSILVHKPATGPDHTLTDLLFQKNKS